MRDDAGRRLPEASVTLIDMVTLVRRTRLTPRDGGYRFNLILPGDYDIIIERFGYRPRLVRHVPVRAGALVQLDVVLGAAASDPAPDTLAFPGAPAGGVHLALEGGAAGDDFAALAELRGLLTGLGGLLPGADGDVAAAGLPGRLGATAIDGVTRFSARHPRIGVASLDGAAFPLAAVHGVEMIPGGIDAEWSGAGGGVLAGFTVPGGRDFSASARGMGGTGTAMGTLVLTGPIVRDTAHFAAGINAVHLTPLLPAPWRADSSAGAAAAIAQDSFQTDLSGYQRTYRATTDIISGFARVDWTLARDQRLSIRAEAANATLDAALLGPDDPAVLGSRVRAKDLSVGALLTSEISSRFGSELRASVDAGSRDDAAPAVPRTSFVDAGVTAGTDPRQPSSVSRTTFRVSETGHFRFALGLLKAGAQLALTTHDQTFADDRAGWFAFGDSSGFKSRTGAFTQTVGAAPSARFQTTQIGLFAQALLHPAPGLDVQLGVRYDEERIPVSDLRLNAGWLSLTGIDNRLVPGHRQQISPRFAFSWTLGAQRRWLVHGEAGQFLEGTDPGEFAEAAVGTGGTSVRRAFGGLGAWPKPPDSTVAPVAGATLTLLGPQYAPPRTGRVLFGLTGNLGGTLIRLAGNYRHTEFLPVRRDLNLSLAPSARDQYDRVLYGTLAKSGSLLGVTPGSNRRFGAFDAVYSLDPSAFSDYWGFTVGLERDVGPGLALLASYTYSRTTDDWFGARGDGPDAQLVPFADTGTASPWTRGRSDFDVPHRVVLGAELRLRGSAAPRLAVLYRWRSGYPFTPGFRDGVDANGDGSGRNDPAFVTDTLPGASDVVSGSSCLRRQIGRLAERNSCRDPSAGALDLRLALTVARFGRSAAELMVDVFGAVRSGQAVYDHALWLVDRAGTLTTSPSHVTTVPLVANPSFAHTLISRDPGAMVRVGLNVGF